MYVCMLSIKYFTKYVCNYIIILCFRIVAAVSLLRQRVNDLRALVDPLSIYNVWVNPPPALSRASTNINRLVNEIDDLIQYEVMYVAINRSLYRNFQ